MQKRLFYWLAVCAGLLFTPSCIWAQAPAWQMAISPGNAQHTYEVQALATDAGGNVYIGGNYADTLTLGSILLPNPRYNADGFIAKWHPTTGFAWAVRVAGTLHEFVDAVVVHDSSVYIMGSTISPDLFLLRLPFIYQQLNNPGSSGGQMGYVAKLTDRGNSVSCNWLLGAPSTGTCDIQALAVSGSNVYVGGYFTGSSFTLGSITLRSSGLAIEDGFVAKISDQGNGATWTWARTIGGTDRDYLHSISVSGNNLYAVGTFSSPSISFSAATLQNTGGSEGFVAKLTDNGTTGVWKWAQAIGGASAESLEQVSANGNNIYVAGSFNSPALTLGAVSVSHVGATSNADGFLAKLTDAGNTSSWQWALPLDLMDEGTTTDLAVSRNTVYASGYYKGASLVLGNTTLQNNTPFATDGYLARLTDMGSSASWSWAQSFSGPGFEQATALSISSHEVYVGGHFSSPVLACGPLSISNSSQSAFECGFLAALTDPTLGTAEDNVGLPAFTLAPNPAHHTATLTGATPGTRFTVCDAVGRAVLTATADAAGTVPLDVRALRAGLYLVRAEGRAGARRLVVE